MKKNFLILVFTAFIFHISLAQTIDQIVEKNQSSICDCVKDIAYIDSELDLVIKFDTCSTLSENDAIQLQKKEDLNSYKEKIYEALETNCPYLLAKRDALIESSRVRSTDSIYLLEKQYKKIEKKVIGSYSLSFGHHSPEGSPTLFIYPKNVYAIISFGDVQIGTWRIVKEKYLHLIPSTTKYPFGIYGRHNPDLVGETRTSFIGNDFSYDTLIYYGEVESNPVLSPIFNIDANCFDFPYVGKIKNTYDQVSLAYNTPYTYEEATELDIYTFDNPQNFNDFIIYETTKNKDRDFTTKLIIGDEKLIFDLKRSAFRSPLQNLNKEEKLFLETLITSKEMEAPTSVYYNDGYQQFNKETITNSKLYAYNATSNSYISLHKDERNPKEKDDYHNLSVVNKFELLDNATLSRKSFQIAEKSIIYTVCD